MEKVIDHPSQDHPEEQPKKETSHKAFYVLIMGCIVLFIIIFSISYFVNKHAEAPGLKTLEYNGFEFVYFPDAAIWRTQWLQDNQPYNIYFHFNPEEAENVPIYQVHPVSDSFHVKSFYVTFDALANNTDYFKIAVAELDLALVRVFDSVPVAACVENNTEPCHTRPIKNCNNTDEPVFYLKQEGEPSIILDDNCIIITGKDKELVRAVDRLLFHWYRIIRESEPLSIVEQ